MSTYDLKIFENLNEYFKVLDLSCSNLDADTCNTEILNTLVTNKCVGGTTISNNNINKEFDDAVMSFAENLKQYDAAMSSVTIRGQLLELLFVTAKEQIFDIVKKSDPSITDYTKINLKNYTSTDVSDKNQLDMIFNFLNKCKDTSNSEKFSNVFNDKTFFSRSTDCFKSLVGKKDLDNIEAKLIEMFNVWLYCMFESPYTNKEKYNEFLVELVTNYPNINQVHLKLLTTYFTIKDENSKDLNWIDVFNECLIYREKNIQGKDLNDLLESSLFKDSRLNVTVVNRDTKKTTKDYAGKNLTAQIVFTLPKNIRSKFNTYLLTNTREKKYSSLKSNFFKDDCKFKLNKKQIDQIAELLENGTESDIDYIDEVEPDESPVRSNDEDDEEKYSFDDMNSMIDHDQWRLDINGKLIKKDKNGNFKPYTDNENNEDQEAFKQNTDGTCNHLCIFSDKKNCEEFFQLMLEKKQYGFEKLKKLIQDKDKNFIPSLNKLKTNINQVNPRYVIGTLRAFAFEKYHDIDSNGNRYIKIESYANWWNRNKCSIGVRISGKSGSGESGSGEPGSGEPGSGESGSADVYEENPNLKLFLKLLVSFINNNKFILNPLTNAYCSENNFDVNTTTEYFTVQGPNGTEKKYRNLSYGLDNSTTTKYTGPEWRDIFKNSKESPKMSFIQKPNEMISIIDLLTYNVFAGLGGKINYDQFKRSYRSHEKYPFHTGGSNSYTKPKPLSKIVMTNENSKELEDYILELPEKSRDIFLAYSKIMLALKAKNLKLDNGYKKKIYEAFDSLVINELELHNTLLTLGNYIKLNNVVEDDNEDKELVEEEVENKVKDFESKQQTVQKRYNKSHLLLSSLDDTSKKYLSPL